MRNNAILTLGLIFALAAALVAGPGAAQAQPRTRTAAAAPPPQKCLKALDGSCTNPAIVEATRLRAVIIPSVRVSYYGTPAGRIGGPFIPFERLFQDNDVLFGLPTAVCAACVTFRSK